VGRGKTRCLTLVKSCLSIRALVVWASLVVFFMAGDVGSKKYQRHHYRLCAALTPGRCSLGLDAARHVVGPISDQLAQA
jgi:hypothetical protein